MITLTFHDVSEKLAQALLDRFKVFNLITEHVKEEASQKIPETGNM